MVSRSEIAWNFNKKYNYIGHLFQDRYRSELIDTDKYLLESSRYIHLNPAKAKMVELPEDYEWSSYNQYIRKTKDRIVECDKILSYFKKDNCREWASYENCNNWIMGYNSNLSRQASVGSTRGKTGFNRYK
ncbi:hypothetical protein [Clostridium gasigenes]|uniref:hypothetical protein n=1 Tax=Clostridium gasigenes TaxID=94869 RepID=UPI001C0AD2F7|nr:hypothetical protein [Clostridium gasigenes]